LEKTQFKKVLIEIDLTQKKSDSGLLAQEGDRKKKIKFSVPEQKSLLALDSKMWPVL
jgi:hypothetical protein